MTGIPALQRRPLILRACPAYRALRHDMPIQRADTAICEDVDRILYSAGQVLTCCHAAYQGGYLQFAHVDATLKLRDDMISMLAKFEDGHDYGLVHDHMLETMRRYEHMASNMVDAVCAHQDSA